MARKDKGPTAILDLSSIPLTIPQPLLKKIIPSNDVLDVYSIYFLTACRQGTNRVWATVGYVAKGLNISKARVREARKILLELGIIRDIQENPGSFSKRYVEVNLGISRTDDYRSTGFVRESAFKDLEVKRTLEDPPDSGSSFIKKKKKKNPRTKEFELFWSQYPKKKAKVKALEKWKLKAKKNELPPLPFLLERLGAFKELEWTDDKYIPFPTTWINQERWNDQLKGEEEPPSAKAERPSTMKHIKLEKLSHIFAMDYNDALKDRKPDRDLAETDDQIALRVMPVVRAIYNGNMRRAERKVRRFAKHLGSTTWKLPKTEKITPPDGKYWEEFTDEK